MNLFGKLVGKEQDIQIAMDIGSHAIKTAVFETLIVNKKTKISKIIKKVVTRLPHSTKQDKIVAKAHEVIFGLVKEAGRVPAKITIGLGPNLAQYSLQNWKSKVTQNKKKANNNDLATAFVKIFEEKRDPTQTMIVHPTAILFNGYAFDAKKRENNIFPPGLLTFNTVVLSFSKEVGLALIDIKRTLGGMPIEFIPLTAAFKESIIRASQTVETLLIDIGGEETSITLFGEIGITAFAFFPYGAHHFTRVIAKIKNIPFNEAEDLKRQYAAGIITQASKLQLDELLKEETNFWKKMFIEKIEEFYAAGPLPKYLFLSGGGAYITAIRDTLKKTDWLGNFSYTNSPEINILRAENLFQENTPKNSLSGPEDAGLASLIVYSIQHEALF